MKSAIWVLALPLSLLAVGELRAQPLPYPAPGAYVYGGGYGGSGGGIGFVYSRRHLSIAGFLGGFGASRYSAGGVYLDAPYLQPPAPPTIILNNQITLDLGGEAKSFKRKLPPQDEYAPRNLDETAPQVSLPPPPAAFPKPLPGQAVSKEVPAVRPAQVAKAEIVPPKIKDIPKQPPPPEPPPQADPREENTRLVKLGLAAFSDQEYVLAAHRFRQATLVDPKSAPAYFFLAQAQFALGKYRPAVESIHAGMNLTKNWPKAPFQPRIDLYKGAEAEFDVQLKRLRDTLAKNAKDPAYLFLTAYQLWFDGRQNEAVALFQQARAVTEDRRFIDQFLAAAAPGPVAAK